MPKLRDLTGSRYGKLTILGRVADRRKGWPRWLCQCDCGNTVEVESNNLRSNNTRSCGCLNTVWIEPRLKAGVHLAYGASKTPTYNIWNLMRQRCENPKNPHYANYGKRGIYVCERWNNFSYFLEDMGWRPSPTHSIERIDNDGPYSPENCHWVGSRYEQAANRRNSRRITHNGETFIVAEWARRSGIEVDTLLFRLNAGWSVEDALTRPAWGQKTITYKGRTLTVRAWAKETGISRRTIADRLKKGWNVSRILSKSISGVG